TLTRDLNQSEITHRQHLRDGPVLSKFALELIIDLLPVRFIPQVDEVDDDDSTDITQAYLLGYHPGRFQIDLERIGFLRHASAGTTRVDVDHVHRFRPLNEEVTPGGQVYTALEGLFDLSMNLRRLKD